MKKLLLYLFLILVFFKPSFSKEIRVVDGDTIIVKGEKIRFSGIDAPEIKQICKKGDQEFFCGIYTKKILIEKIGNEIPKCISEGRDIYKRTLAECFVKGESLSVFLVRNGYAFAYRKYSKKFVEDEEFAKKNKMGIWKMEFEYPWNFRKKN